MIQLKQISLRYHSEVVVDCLDHIDLDIAKGEMVLLTGPSGCGKSSIIRLINGLIPHYYEGDVTGTVCVKGRNIAQMPLYETAQFVGTVFQNPKSQFFNVDTTSELAFGCENMGIPEEEILKRIHLTVHQFGIEKLMDRNIFNLSGGEKQEIACASIAVSGPDIILMDEPSANLDHEAIEHLRALIKIWKKQGKTIVIAEHRLSYAWDLADRIIVMHQGRIVETFDHEQKKKVSQNKLREYGLRSIQREEIVPIWLTDHLSEMGEGITLKNFSFAYHPKTPVFKVNKMNIPTGEIVAIVGENGIGKTTFLHCLCGLKKKCKGQVVWNRKIYKRKARMKQMFIVMQDANHQLFTESVLDEVLLSMKKPNIDRAREILKSMDLLEYGDRHPISLSGGQKQRVAIASAIASEREILLFDEPTSGLDYGHMMQVSKIMKKLQQMGKTILVVTHDHELIQNCCTRIIKLEAYEGSASGE